MLALLPKRFVAAGSQWRRFKCIFLLMIFLLMFWFSPSHAHQSALDGATAQARNIGTLWWWMFYGFSAVFTLTMLLLGIALWRTRKQRRALSQKNSVFLVTGAGVVVPLLTVIALVGGSLMLGRSISEQAPDNAVPIEIKGRMWWWEVRYLNSSGETIATTANEIVVPIGRPVKLLLTSDNVIHSFWVPELHGKTDLVPGRTNVTWFTAEESGTFRGQCAEFCGTQHALMGFTVTAVPAAAYERWLGSQIQAARAPGNEQQRRGLQVFMRQSCGNCHTIRGTAANGQTGPDLSHFASRATLAAATKPNNVGHLAGWIADPQNIKPGAKMPRTLLESQQLLDLVAYLDNLK